MPIRTRRGRAGAYRALWEWPLRSPLRLLVTLVAVCAVVAGLAALGAGSSGTSGSRANALGPVPDGPTTVVGTGAGAGTAPPELTPTTLPLSSAPAAALGVAQRWATAWADHPAGTTTDAWTAGLAPFTTAEYLPQLASVDPANVPGSRVTGPPQAVEVRPDAVRVQVPTDAVRLDLLLVQVGPGDWRVAGYDRAA